MVKKKAKPKIREFWLARNEKQHAWLNPWYSLSQTKPRINTFGKYISRTTVRCFCAADFERVTGYVLRPGKCKKVRIRVEEVK
jgi:hypothetical protein